MTVSKEDLLKAIGAVKNPLGATVTNARGPKKTVRRVIRRIKNAEEEEPIEEIVEEPPVEETEETEEVAEVGDTVVIQPTTEEIVGEIVEVIPEEEAADEEYVEEEPVQNQRRYRRIKNARILRNADGSQDVLVPLTTKESRPQKVQNYRRYRTRTVALNSEVLGDAAYAKTVKTPDVASWAATVNKAQAFDHLLMNASIEQSIDEALKKALAKNGVNNSKSSACKNAKVRRFRNYRRIRNEDGTVSIEVNIDEGNDVPDVTHITAEPVEPVAEYVPEENVDVVVDGRDVPLDNARTAKRVRNTAVKNEGGDAALDPPTTFPSK